ncbi:MAG: cytoskeleton protein RodZ [Marinobacter excellens HL-55]|uniref:Cytoskeleton protein RodZ n=1 Tax=Marinobacter excellens HL-55 TaxID=1305731 RepID=A0A0P7YCU5_9GAMM|nr:MAG: cytoskeleton protein RodZ [Marinobacter excellens HL-55]
MSGDEQAHQVTTESVGDQLRLARERLGLDISAIADEQHLRPSVIQAIENGDYSKIDTELFLKGYVRTYARQVGLDADAVIADLNQELEPVRQQKELEQQASPLVSIERTKRRKRQIAKLLIVMVIVAVTAYLVVGYLAGRDADSVPSPASESTSDTSAPSEEVEVSDLQGQEADLLAPPQDDSEPPLFEEVVEPAVSVTDTVTAEVAPQAEPDLPQEIASDGAPDDQMPMVTQTTEPALQDSAQLPGVSEPTQARLQMSFSDDCWIQITDAGGNRLASSLRRSGDQLDVSGEAPLRIVVGAVSAVESIRFQGETLNVGDLRVVNNRSEFTLEL